MGEYDPRADIYYEEHTLGYYPHLEEVIRLARARGMTGNLIQAENWMMIGGDDLVKAWMSIGDDITVTFVAESTTDDAVEPSYEGYERSDIGWDVYSNTTTAPLNGMDWHDPATDGIAKTPQQAVDAVIAWLEKGDVIEVDGDGNIIGVIEPTVEEDD